MNYPQILSPDCHSSTINEDGICINWMDQQSYKRNS